MIRKYDEKADDIYIAIWILFSAAMGAGVSMSNMPSISKAKQSGAQIFEIIDEKSTLDVRNETGKIKDIKQGAI